MSEASHNRQVRLAARPVGLPQRSDWQFGTEPVRALAPGEVLVEVIYVSLDPAMRGWMNEARSYVAPVRIGEVMRALGAGRVRASEHPGFRPGDCVVGQTGVQEYCVARARDLTRVDAGPDTLARYLSALGMPGMTAYFGLLDVGALQPGETVLVSAAAGAVGMVAGQIARIRGCRVVGIAGGAEKCAYIVEELGFHAAIDYKNADLEQQLALHCPRGIDVYFDNVGGEMLDSALKRIARGARIVLCGAVSQYNAAATRGPANYLALLVNRARMQGFLVFDYAARFAHAAREIETWIAAGQLRTREHIVAGLENFPEALQMLFSGANVGKLLLQVRDAG